MKQIFFLILSLLFIISNETIFDGRKKCIEGKIRKCFVISPVSTRCFCYDKCPEGKKLVCYPFLSPHYMRYSIKNCECKQITKS